VPVSRDNLRRVTGPQLRGKVRLSRADSALVALTGHFSGGFR